MSPFCPQNLPLLYPLGLGTFGDTFGDKLGTRTDLGGDNDDSDEGENEVFEEQPKGILFLRVKHFYNYQSTIEIIKMNLMKINHPLRRRICPDIRKKESMMSIPLSW